MKTFDDLAAEVRPDHAHSLHLLEYLTIEDFEKILALSRAELCRDVLKLIPDADSFEDAKDMYETIKSVRHAIAAMRDSQQFAVTKKETPCPT